MRLLIIYICILISTNEIVAQNNKKTLSLKDSILQRISWQEYLDMNIYEQTDFIRKMRGLNSLFLREEEIVDQFGIKKLKAFDTVRVLRQIGERYNIIEKEKTHYLKWVFPNAYKDVVEEFFGSFYKNVKERELTFPNYQTLEGSNHDGDYSADGAWNNTKRTYYFNDNGELRLIEIIRQRNVNDGLKYDFEDKITKIGFDKQSYYIWNDSLQFYFHSYQNDKIKTGHVDYSDTLTAYGFRNLKYFYLNNCFRGTQKTGDFELKNWEKNLESSNTEITNNCNNIEVINLRNLVLEYEEYEQGVNEYLKPVKYSFIKKPYTIRPDH